MHTIYVGHARHPGWDVENELYVPLDRMASLGVRVLLPHRTQECIDTKTLFQSGGCDLFVAEVTYASTGLGMELAYADLLGVPTVCVFQRGTTPGGSVKGLNIPMLAYDGPSDLITLVEREVRARGWIERSLPNANLPKTLVMPADPSMPPPDAGVARFKPR